MDKRFAIFDLDGTLVDSMPYWSRLASEFLTAKGIRHIPADLLEQIKPMTMSESAALFLRRFPLEGPPQRLAGEMNALMDAHYRRDIPLKPWATPYLAALRVQGVALCVASATGEPLMEACLSRLGVRHQFQFLLSCETVGAGKRRPDVYLEAARRLGCAPGEAAVYEDALYAAATAKDAGFYVVGVYDPSAQNHWGELVRLADETLPAD